MLQVQRAGPHEQGRYTIGVSKQISVTCEDRKGSQISVPCNVIV